MRSPLPELTVTEGLQDRYDFQCPKCEKEMSAAPSFAMRSGLNMGGGSCLRCGIWFSLKINDDNRTMTAEETPGQ